MKGDNRQREEPIPGDPRYFGGCPECGKNNGYLNIWKEHWFYCRRHSTKWCHGVNLFGSHLTETADDWMENLEFLSGFKEVKAVYPPE